VLCRVLGCLCEGTAGMQSGSELDNLHRISICMEDEKLWSLEEPHSITASPPGSNSSATLAKAQALTFLSFPSAPTSL